MPRSTSSQPVSALSYPVLLVYVSYPALSALPAASSPILPHPAPHSITFPCLFSSSPSCPTPSCATFPCLPDSIHTSSAPFLASSLCIAYFLGFVLASLTCLCCFFLVMPSFKPSFDPFSAFSSFKMPAASFLRPCEVFRSNECLMKKHCPPAPTQPTRHSFISSFTFFLKFTFFINLPVSAITDRPPAVFCRLFCLSV